MHILRLMMFDLSINGHHPAYIQHLIHYWGMLQLPIAIDIVVSSKFTQNHSDVTDLVSKYNHCSIRFVPISAEEESEFKPRNLGALQRMQRPFQEWRLLCHYAKSLKADHCVILYFDPYQLSLIFAQKAPCSISGIYFRPTFHYQNFIQCNLTLRDKIQQVREQLLLQQVLRNTQLKTLFCLDPFAVQYLQQIQKRVQIFPLPDPVIETSLSSLQILKLREKLGVKKNRKICLLFGALTGRKGIYETLNSLLELPINIQEELCVIFAGQANPQDRQRITDKITEFYSINNVQIISQFEFISEPEVPAYFQLADIILAPYQHHVGMSGILLQAAAARKPVLSSNFGLMGEIVRKNCLGLAIDSSNPSEIASALNKLLSENNIQYFDVEKMRFFVEENSADKFSKILFEGILQAMKL